MSKEIYISSTPHETRLAIVESDDLTEIYYERENEYTLAGSIYNGKVTRVLPGMQSSFVDIGLERDAFLYITDFMEEAGDSADFEAADNASGSRRPPRDDRNGNREDRAPRDEARTTSLEGATDGDRLSASPSAEPRSDRSEREGGRRRRGNRDGRGGYQEGRNANQEGRSSNVEGRSANGEGRGPAEDRGGSRDHFADGRGSAPVADEPGIDLPPAIHSGYVEPGAEGNSAEMGEGAPGADGSRRWRGRRGRRRGRGAAPRDESQAVQQPSASPASDLETPPAPGRGYQGESADAEDVEEDFDGEYNASFDLEASAPAPATSQEHPAAPSAESERSSRTSEDQPSRERGDRDLRDRDSRDRGRRDRGGRDRGDRSPRAPRGFAPSRALYGVEASEAEQPTSDGPASEPIILPGEVLSKYRKPDDSAVATSGSASPQTQTPAPRPSTEFTLPGTWDGGNVLPGETIRPRSGAAADASSEHRSDRGGDSRGSRDRGNRRGDRDRDRDDRSSGRRGGRDDRGDREPSRSFAAPPSIAPLRSEAPAPNPELGYPEAANQQVTEPEASRSAPDLREEKDFAADVRPVEQDRPATEYEPTEASASLRFDPTTRSEFRQSAPVIDTPEHEGAPPLSADPFEFETASSPEPVDAAVPADHGRWPGDEPTSAAEPVHSIAHTITPQPGVIPEPIQPVQSMQPMQMTGGDAEITRDDTEASSSGHEFTAIQGSGEMLSEAPAPPPQEMEEPTSPIHHETAVLEASGESASTDSVTTSATPLFEEETVEEEDEDFGATTLHASSIEEMDYEEEQTLEGAADLGTMIREMSIDQITRPGDDPEDDEDILEEEDAADDFGEEYNEPELEGGSDSDFEAPSESSHQDSFEATGFTGQAQGDEFRSEASASTGSSESSRDPERRSGRRDGGRRDGRRGDRGRDRGGDRARSTGGSGDRSTSRPGRRDGRHSAQSTNLPAISDLLKPGQEVLVQIAKEPIAKKGARITSHIALPGRFLVFMPTVNHTGVSRKIESDAERRRLKEILLSEKGEASGGFIVRTAAANASEEELRSDLRFLLNLWADIKQRSESSKSPALIYHDLNLVERILRDQVTDTFSAIWVDTETEYERVLRFLQRFQPSLIRRVKLYTKETPLFEQFGITEEINKALRSKVWLKSGGSIVINQTEALVAIDINTGKYVGKTARLEDTIVKTNLDAIPEIVRQIRLRDLGGIIIIDFIDMDERKNRHKVMTALEEELKKDRAPSKVLQFNDFGLVAITRKRVKQSLERTLSATCNVCQGTGMTKSPVTVCNDIYIEMRKMQRHLDRGDVMLRVHPDVVKQLKAVGTRWLQEMEEMVGKTILVKSDPSLHPEQFDIH